MSAEDLGTRMLGEVGEEKLDMFLQRLRESTPSRLLNLTHIPALDRLLNIFVSPSCTGFTQIPVTQQQQKYLLPAIELTSTSPCAGKTHILYYLTCVATLPSHLGAIPLHGRASSIIVLDTDSRFSVTRLYQIIKQYIGQCSTSVSLQVGPATVEDAVRTALLHVHIFRPQSSSSLLATVHSLHTYLLSGTGTHFSHHHPVAAVLVDSLTAFVHQDRVAGKEFAQRYADIVSALRKLQTQLDCPIVATTWSTGILQKEPYPNKPPGVRAQLPAVWSNFVTVRLVVERDEVAKFAEGMSAREAWKEREMRQNVVVKGGFSGWVDRGGEEDWGIGVRERLRRVEGGGFFWFTVTEEGVKVDE